jgi:hypothetical protein
VAKYRPDQQLWSDDEVNVEHMGSTTLDDANPATAAGLASSRYIKIDRGNDGRVRVHGPA